MASLRGSAFSRPSQLEKKTTFKYQRINSIDAIHIFTDGSYSSKTKTAGYSAIFPPKYKTHTLAHPIKGTNQLAELTAIHDALIEIHYLEKKYRNE